MDPELRRTLALAEEGDARAANELIDLLYGHLHRFAARRVAAESPSATLQPTALVHEAYLRLRGDGTGDEQRWDSRGHFLAAAAEAIRRILIERARAKGTRKRGGGYERLGLEALHPTVDDPPVELLDLDEALGELEALDPRQARIVHLRLYAGSTIEQVAAVCGISRATAERDWRHAKLWLFARLSSAEERS